MDVRELPPAGFDRQDESSDAGFYVMPRFVLHIDEATVAALTAYYAEVLQPEMEVLDAMSSWVSHLPQAGGFRRVSGLGMNPQELAGNPQLDDWTVHDLNADPRLPYPDESFDAVINAVSVQYLKRPLEVFADIARVLRPGGRSIVAMSHRCFPTKAIRAFHYLDGGQRLQLVASYHEQTGGFEVVEQLDRSPSGADPLWIVNAAKAR